MICMACRTENEQNDVKKLFHDQCRGGTWCDCQHRVKARTKAEVVK